MREFQLTSIKHWLSAGILSLTALGITTGCDSIDDELAAQTAQIDALRAAIPSSSRLSIELPSETPDGALTVAGDNKFAALGDDIGNAINSAAEDMITLLETIVAIPPTLYNEESNEAIWGPFDNDDGVGQVVVYIKENQEDDADFKYEYAFVRLVSGGDLGDPSEAFPVIFGAATPDEADEDKGVGITLWDFEANRSFEEAHNEDANLEQLPTGRFVSLYGNVDGDAENDEFLFNYAVFNNFRETATQTEALNTEIFYSLYSVANEGVPVYVRTLDMTASGDFCSASGDCGESGTGSMDENLTITKAFINERPGRAEIVFSGGDLANDNATATECWDATLDATYRAYSAEGTDYVEFGTPAECISPFENSLADLELPTLQALAEDDPSARSAMLCVAENGLACTEL